MQIQSCYIHWVLVIENLKRFQSLSQQLVFNLKKIIISGWFPWLHLQNIKYE